MPITVEVADISATKDALNKIFSYFEYVDEKFSTYKETSEISRINRGELKEPEFSGDMKTILALSEETKKQTNGYFDIVRGDGTYDPSGLVKGWSIYNASNILLKDGFVDFYIDAGGDVQVHGKNAEHKTWSVGIKNPFNQKEIVKVLYVQNEGVATSGTYIRGQHIYDPKKRSEPITDIVSLTVVGPNIYEADRFATAAFAMGKEGVAFIEKLELFGKSSSVATWRDFRAKDANLDEGVAMLTPRKDSRLAAENSAVLAGNGISRQAPDGFEGYMIDKNGVATMTSGFERYTKIPS